MDLEIYSIEGQPVRTTTLPPVFSTPFRPDLIKRAVLAQQTHTLQPYGPSPLAGMKTSAESQGVGRGIARVPRVKGHGSPSASRGARAPFTVGGRASHPPTPAKRIHEKINRTERRLAINSAIAATTNPILVIARGHAVMDAVNLPIIVENQMETLSTTRDVATALQHLGAWPDVQRAKGGKKIRAGKGKRRGRKYKRPKGPLLVINEDRGIIRGATNLPGLDVIRVAHLNANVLAPGTVPGRFTIWIESAVKALEPPS
ncbi:MAG: 50S ribosomal protein L4 [Candidatus Heimdallarchaeota archaeon]